VRQVQANSGGHLCPVVQISQADYWANTLVGVLVKQLLEAPLNRDVAGPS
jgi:hypothetical protein